MKIVQTEGCTASGWTFDGKMLDDMAEQDLAAVRQTVLDQLLDEIGPHRLTTELVCLLQYDDYKCDGEPCGQCGDTVSETVWNI